MTFGRGRRFKRNETFKERNNQDTGKTI